MTFKCDEVDDFYDEGEGCMCPRCMGQGSLNCYCGGDQCYCENQGDVDCSLCLGDGEVSQERYDAYCKRENEMHAAFHGFKYWSDEG